MTEPIQRDRLGSLTKIARGGQGVVYQAPNAKARFGTSVVQNVTSMVYKEYKAEALAAMDFDALAKMPAFLESLRPADAERLISIGAWPCATVEVGDAPTGFVMPVIPDAFYISLTTVKGVSRATAEFQHLLNDPSILVQRGIALNDVQRYTLLREVASAMAFLHKNGVCVGDVSPKNLLFSLEPEVGTYFIDCDAMSVNGISAVAQVETPGWAVPPGEELATIYSDAYKLGLLAVRLLAGDQDVGDPHALPEATPALLRQIITETLTQPTRDRPLPVAWTYILGSAIEEAQHQMALAAAAPARPATMSPQPPAAPPPAAPPRPAPYAPPPPPAAKSPNVGLWIAAAVAVIAVVVAAIAITANVVGKKNNSNTADSGSQSSETAPSASPSYSTSTYSAPTPPTASGPPPGLKPDPDQWGDSCNSFSLPGSPTHVGRGTDGTSCLFAEQVLRAYVSQPSRFNGQTVQIDVQSPRTTCPMARDNANPSPPTAILCSGNDFVMTCTPMDASNNWVDCRGGNLAEVYLY